MSVAARIWYGTAQASGRDEQSGMIWLAPAVCLAAFVVRLILPFDICDTGLVYASAVEGLVTGADWSKQMLVGAVEYPPLPLILGAGIFGGVKLMGVATAVPVMNFLVAGAQVWICSYVWRIFRLYLPAKLAVVPAVGGFTVLAAFGGAVADPSWIMAVPAAGMLFHVARFEQHGNLRDLAVVGLYGGLLALCGVTGLCIGLLGCLTLWGGGKGLTRRAGGFFLLILPIAYVSSLYPLANWLVMGDPFFFVRRLSPGEAVASTGFAFSAAAVIAAIVLAALPKVRTTVRLGVVWAAGLMAISLFVTRGTGHLADFGILSLVAGIALIVGVASSVLRSPGMFPMVISVVAVSLALPAAFFGFSRHQQSARFSESGSPPSAGEMIELIDRHWQGSRVLVYDLRTASLYAQHDSQRFVSSLDYNPYVFEERATGEQLHLLVPPNNGRFYSKSHPLLARAHAGEGERLFLEQVWPGDWQLWRCVRPIRPEALGMTSREE